MQSRVPVLNQAIRAARSEYLIFIEGDCLPHRRFIEDHMRHAYPNSFVQGRRARVRARYVHRVHTPFRPMLWLMRRRILGVREGVRRPWPSIRINDRRLIHGCNFAVWRKDLIRVNGFDETFDEPGYELIELAERLLNSGLTLRTITGQAIVYHLDHRHLARYGTLNSERILERTRQEKRTTCDRGLVQRSTFAE
jgi:GT2 family glycosyltransferase